MSSTLRRKDFQSIRAELVKAHSLFVDPEFPPNNTTLFYNGVIPPELGTIVWKRPTDIVQKPHFVIAGLTRHDLDQGFIGNCWFVAAAATVATFHKKQFERVVPTDQGFGENYAGIFHFNFWWYGKWVEIIIDDYLPTDGYGLIYCRNKERPDEFWSALLEKAYAKLRGCYEALDGGKLQDALVDLTGGMSEVIDLRDRSKLPHDLYGLMLHSLSMNSMLGCSIYRPENATRPEVRKENGLYMGHAYSITAMKELTTTGRTYQLLRLRNPWGRGEWNGAWSDIWIQMQNLSPELRSELNFRAKADGEFWIAFEDFVANFDEVQICHLQPDAFTEEIARDGRKQHWNVTVYHDAWIKGVTAGGCGNPPNQRLYWKNPQFFVTLSQHDEMLTKNKCTLIVSLLEKEKDNRTKIAIGFDVYQLRNPDKRPLDGEKASRNALRLAERSGSYQFYREVSRRFELPPGTYVIIPSTFYPHMEAGFMLRLYTEKKIDSGVLDEDVGPSEPIKPPQDMVSEAFTKHSGQDNKMDATELKSFLADISFKELKTRFEFSTEACRSLLSMMDRNRSGFLDESEAKQLWQEVKTYKDVFRSADADNSGSVDTFELGAMFNKLGFPVSRGVLTSIVRRYGGRDSRITLEDFVIIITKLILMYNIFLEHQKNSGGIDGVAQFTRNEFLQYTMFC